MTRLDCPLQARCPGCPLGAEDYESGLERKAAALGHALASYPELGAEVLPARAAAPVVGYRLRAKLVVDGAALGLFERGSHRVIDVSGCRVLSPELTTATGQLRRALPLPIYGADLRTTSEGVMLTLQTDDASARPRLEAAARELAASGLRSVALSVRRAGSVRLLSGEPEVVVGPSTARHQLSDARPYAYAAPGGFVQAHAGQASYVHSAIIARLQQRWGTLSGRHLVELFAGNGALALALAAAGARVTAVESYAPATQLAERAALEQGLPLSAVTRDAARYAQRSVGRERFDAAIVNPPRRGLEPALREALASSSAETIGYLSCNPRTLARDAWHLRLLGLELRQAEPLDMIPWSDAVETLAWLERAHPPAPRVLLERGGWLAVEKSPWQSTATGLLARVRATLAPAAVALDQWGSGASGVCWFAKDPSAASELNTALASAQRELTLLVRGNLRKQGTITRRQDGSARPGTRYRKLRSIARHSLASVLTEAGDESAALRDFASIGHPVLGDARFGDARSNEHVEHRHGLDRAFVHCSSVKLRLGGELLQVTSELAPDLAQAQLSLELD